MVTSSLSFNTLKNFNPNEKKVVLRVDLDVPVDDKGHVSDSTRLQSFLPTLQYLLDNKASIILLGHFKRPHGQKKLEMSLINVCKYLSTMIKKDITFFEHTPPILKSGEIAMRENTRFDPREETNDPNFSKELSSLGDIFVFDAFAVSHRSHASTTGIMNFLPSYAGHLVEKEYSFLQRALEKPEKPVMAIVGGAKISTKIDLLLHLTQKVDYLVLGGGMANTFLYAQGHNVAKSLFEKDMKNTALNILKQADIYKCQIIVPHDFVTAREFKKNSPSMVKTIKEIQSDDMILDTGPQTIEYVKTILEESKTLLWNGPLGAFETAPFEKSTLSLARHIAKLCETNKLFAIAGGGDTSNVLSMAGVKNKLSHVSSAGGAFLQMAEGKPLQAIEALKKNAQVFINE